MRKGEILKKAILLLAALTLLAAPLTWADEEATITGTIEKTDQGIVLSADNGESFLVKGRDLSDMVGRSVQATGTLSEEMGGMTITIIAIEEIGSPSKQ